MDDRHGSGSRRPTSSSPSAADTARRTARAGGGTRTRSLAARARYNARIAMSLDPRSQDALTALLDAGRGYASLARRLVAVDGEQPRDPGPHDLCRILGRPPHPLPGGNRVALQPAPIARYLEQRADVPARIAGALSEALAAATGASVGPLTLGTLPLAALLTALVVLVCPDLDACGAQQTVLAALADPGATHVLENVDLPR